MAAQATPLASMEAELDTLFDSAPPPEETTAVETEETPAAPAAEETLLTETEAPAETETSTTKAEPEPAEPEPVAATSQPADDAGIAFKENGKEYIKYPKARGQAIYGAYQASRKLAAAITGNDEAPLTPELIQGIQKDKAILDSLQFDISSPDPAIQARAFGYLLSSGALAFKSQHVSTNPHAFVADAFLGAAAKHAPEVVEQITVKVRQQIIDQLYEKGVAEGHNIGEKGEIAFSMAQNLDKELNGGKFRSRKDAKRADPIDTRLQRVEEGEARLSQAAEAEQQKAWTQWHRGTLDAVGDGVDGEIDTFLKPSAFGKEKLSTEEVEVRNTIVLRLQKEIKDAIAADHNWVEARKRTMQAAMTAGSERVRDQLRTDLRNQYAAKTRQVLRDKAGPIVSAHALVKQQSNDAAHSRLADTQRKKAVPTGAPAGNNGNQGSNGKMSIADFHRELDELI